VKEKNYAQINHTDLRDGVLVSGASQKMTPLGSVNSSISSSSSSS
jgi:predicted class III extradiol MEMO1 family dioxygenase